MLNCADYGVPQTRERFFLIARRDGRPIVWPTVTHTEQAGLFTDKWVSMLQAIGIGFTQRPSTTVLGATEHGGGHGIDGGSGARAAVAAAAAAGEWIIDRRRPDATAVRQRRLDEPSPTVTAQAGCRAPWEFYGPDEHDLVDGFCRIHRDHCTPDLTVSIGANTMKHSREIEDMVPYERPVDQPAPTVDTKASSAWQIGEPGHRQPPHSFKMRGSQNSVIPLEQGGDGVQRRRDERDQDQPSFTVVPNAESTWKLELDAELADRPATTIAADPRIFPPGGHTAHDGRDNTRTVGRSEGAMRVSIEQLAILQGFPPGWQWVGTKTEQSRQVGNAVPPIMAELLVRANMPDLDGDAKGV